MGNKGPYKIVWKLNEVSYAIQRTPRLQALNSHIDRLLACTGEVPACWAEVESGMATHSLMQMKVASWMSTFIPPATELIQLFVC